MSRPRVCDICRRPTEIGAKLYIAPLKVGSKTVAGDYTAHLDVGKCCMDKVLNLGHWTRRKVRNGNTLAASKGAAKKQAAGAGSGKATGRQEAGK